MSVLDTAFDLIEKGQLADANSLLTANEAEFASNPDYWWLLAHASDDPVQGRNALNQVLALDKNYPGAKELDSQVRATEVIQNASEPRRQSRWFPLMLVVLLLLAVGIILFLLANASGGTPTTPTEVAQSTDETTTEEAAVPTLTEILIVPTTDDSQATIVFDATSTLEETETSVSVATEVTTDEPATEESAFPTLEAVATEEPTATIEEIATEVATEVVEASPTEDTGLIEPTIESQAVPVTYAFMQGQSTPENGVVIDGNTLKIQLCAVPGIEAGNAIRDILLTISIGTAELDAAIQVIEIALVDCTNQNVEQRVVAIDRSFVESFASGSINLQQLQQEIRPVR
jgi:cytoskeletal protein RodZ